MSKGVIIGCDIHQQWMLPWWWRHYSAHNSYPIVFVDFGMSEEALSWCKEKGECVSLSSSLCSISLEDEISPVIKSFWEERYGTGFWIRRNAWFKKPFSLLHSQFSTGIWIDVDCQINANLEGLFQCIGSGAEIAVSRDRLQSISCLMPEEIHYNSGVIVFRKEAPILHHWVQTSIETEHLLPGDQETLSRAISLFKPNLIELPPIYNWYRTYEQNDKAVINHFCGGLGKIEILRSFSPQNSIESLLLLQSLQSTIK